MLRILIADDEALVKIGLRNAIDWQANGYEIVAEARNGLQALELARETHPDIVLTDIRMPKMTGLELIEALSAEQPNVKYIILSAYGEFEYARHALRMGVLEYILKLSMEPDALLEVLSRVRAQIEREDTASRAQAQRQLERGAYRIERRSQLIKKLASPDDATAIDPELLPPGRIAVVSALLQAPPESAPVETALSIERILSDEGAVAFYHDAHHCGLLIPAPPPTDCAAASETTGRAAMLERLASLATRISESLGAPCTIGFGGFAATPGELPRALEAARRTPGHAFYRRATVLDSAALPAQTSAFQDPIWHELRRLIADNQLDLLQSALLDGLAALSNSRHIEPTSLCEMVRRVLQSLLEKLEPAAPELELPAAHHIDALRAWAEECVSRYRQQKAAFYGDDIARALDFIDAHYTQDLHLSDLAALLYKNESYISHLFKKRIGISFVDYITLVRIQKAKELLINSTLPITAVSERAGFNDVAYFCRVFKRHVDLSPHQYRAHALSAVPLRDARD